MRASMLPRLTTWLCLAITLLMGVSPARGLVLCIEADGTIALEVAADACDGCPDAAAEGRSDTSTALVSDGGCCECIDIPVSTSDEEERIVTKRMDVRFDAWCPPLAIVVASSAICGTHAQPRSHVAPARGAHALRLIRSVVLHV